MARRSREQLEALARKHAAPTTDVETAPIETPPATVHGAARSYRVLREIGRGGMAVVWLALDTSVGRRVAVKQPRAGLSALAKERFDFEGWVQSQLEHPNIIPVHDFSPTYNDDAFIVMQLVSAPSWDRDPRWASPRSTRQKRAWTRVLIQVLSALAHAHEHGIVHRDVKPANILVRDDDNVYLGDWGVAYIDPDTRLLDDDAPDRLTERGDRARAPLGSKELDEAGLGETIAVGSPWYRAPEQVSGRTPTPGADIFACGRILERIWGVDEGAVEAEYRAAVQRLPRRIAEIGRAATARQPEDRYADAATMASDLQAFLDGRVLSLDQHKPVEHVRRFVANQCAALAVAAVFVCALVVLWHKIELARSERTAATTAAATADVRWQKAQAAEAEVRRVLEEIGGVIEGATYRLGTLRALQIIDELLVAMRGSASPEEVVAQANEERAIALVDLGNRDDAVELIDDVLALRRRLVAEAPTVEAVRKLVATTVRVGDLEVGETRWGLFLDAHEMLERLRDESPTPGVLDDLVWSHIRQSNPKIWRSTDGSPPLSDSETARAHLREAERIALSLHESQPDDARRVHGLVTVWLRQLESCDEPGQLERIDRALELARRIPTLVDVNIVQLATYRTAVQHKLDSLAANGGTDVERRRLLHEIFDVSRTIAERDGGVPRYEQFALRALWLAECYETSAPDRAREFAQKAIDAALEIRKQVRNNRVADRVLAGAASMLER